MTKNLVVSFVAVVAGVSLLVCMAGCGGDDGPTRLPTDQTKSATPNSGTVNEPQTPGTDTTGLGSSAPSDPPPNAIHHTAQ
jgi:hypothetical protein